MADVELKTNLSIGGDAEYKKALKGINDELKVAKSGMAAATSEFARNDKSVKANQTRYQELQKVYAAQSKKVELMRAELDKLEKSEGASEGEINKMKIALNNATAQMNKMKLEMDGLGDATDEESKKTEKATKATKNFGEQLKKIGGKAITKSMKGLAAGFAAMSAAAVAAGKSMAGFIGGAGEYADEISTLSMKTGVSADTLQRWRYAEGLMDVDVSTMTGAMKKLTAQMSRAKDGSKSAMANFKALGVSIKDSNGNLRDSEDVFYDAIDALGRIDNETERDAMAMKIFGKSATELNPLIEAGTDEMRALGDEADRTGFVLSDKLMWGANRYQDAHDKMTNASEGLRNTIGALLGPTLAGFADDATDMMNKVTNAIKDGLQPGELETIMADLQSDFSQLFGKILQTAKKFVPFFTGAVTSLITTIVDALPGYVETMLPAVTGMLNSILESLIAQAGPLASLASDVIVNLATFLTDNLPKVTDAAVTIFDKLIDGLTESLPKLIPMAVQMIVKLAVSLVKAIPVLVSKLPTITKAIIDGLKDINWLELGTELITGLATGLNDAAVAGWNAIKSVFDSIWKAVLGIFGIKSDGDSASSTLAADAAKNILNGLISGFSGAVDAVLTSVKEIFGRIWDAIKSIFGFGKSKEQKAQESEASDAGKGIMDGMKSGIKDNEKTVKEAGTKAGEHTIDSINKSLGNKNGKSSKGQDIGKNLAAGFAQGIADNQSKITKAAKDAAKAAYDAARKELDIHSPSKVMMKIGAFYDMGFAEGINKNANKVMEAANELSAAAAHPNSGYNATTAGMAAAAATGASGGGTTVNVNTTYSGPFSQNDAGVFGQVLARSLSGAVAVMG